MSARDLLREKKRIVIKVGSSTLTHGETGALNLIKMERLVRELTDLRNQGREVVLVTSGAIAVGRKAVGIKERPVAIATKQACAAVGQGRLMMVYQKLFSEYNQVAAQILMTRNTMVNDHNRHNAQNTFEELLMLGAIPIVNENDTVSTYELNRLEQFGDNDTLSAVVAALIHADLLILLSDIDGLFTDDPNQNPNASFIHLVEHLDDKLMSMGKGSGSSVGTGGMATKLTAARLATTAGADMIIANGHDVGVIHEIMEGHDVGTLFLANPQKEFRLKRFLEEMNV
ncbi:MAG: glutamate 5-kinase [Lachnospiraceae bacterium]|nr:glutamate 5-kinase [Lachnospiraceae bacterium]